MSGRVMVNGRLDPFRKRQLRRYGHCYCTFAGGTGPRKWGVPVPWQRVAHADARLRRLMTGEQWDVVRFDRESPLIGTVETSR